jgi:ParB-like chromosome segregation protein Spo0J
MSTYQVMPPLQPEDFDALLGDIKARGVLVPVEYDEDGNILDGHHRVKACEQLGITEWPRFIRKGLTEDEKRAHARQLNLARRHLNRDQKRELIKAQLVETPERSNRQVAEALGVDHKTVQAVRSEGESIGEIPQCDRQTSDGRKYPAQRKPAPAPKAKPEAEPVRKPLRTAYVDPTPEGRKEALDTAKQIRKETIKVRGTQGTGENEWYTPQIYINAAREVMGRIDLDPASSALANEKVGANRFFDIDADGLAQEWGGSVWMNPPYAQPFIAQFCAKLRDEYKAGRVEEAICLTHNYTDTEWFHRLQGAANAICFTRGRVKFESPHGEIAAPTQGQAFFYLGSNPVRFADVFSQFGFLMVPAYE